MRSLHHFAYLRFAGLLVLLLGTLVPGSGVSAYASHPGALSAPRVAPFLAPDGTRVDGLSPRPVHLWQYNSAPDAYANPQGCGAFSTAMALSVYDPTHYGTYATAHYLFTRMVQVPFFGGTFEHQNAVVAGQAGFIALNHDHGTVGDLVTAVNLGAPVILLLNPNFLGIGQHDVLLVGYRAGADGQVRDLLIDDPAQAAASRPDAPAEPGNQVISLTDLPARWTGVFTAIFDSSAVASAWQAQAGR
jgi:hypothetical protein